MEFYVLMVLILYVVSVCPKLCTPYHGFIQMCLGWTFHVSNDLVC
jgi:hypothetical protein